jgi:hypothetical protein
MDETANAVVVAAIRVHQKINGQGLIRVEVGVLNVLITTIKGKDP